MLGFKTQGLPKDFLKGEFFNVCAIQMILLKILQQLYEILQSYNYFEVIVKLNNKW